MNKRTIGMVLVAVALIAIGGIAVATQQSQRKTQPANQTAHDATNSDSQHKEDEKKESGSEDLTNQTEVFIDIKDFVFTKKDITIKKGTKVTWINQDTVKHNAFSDDSKGPKGELLAKGESYSFTFDEVGTTNYYCTPHPYMKGIVNVVE